MNSNYYVGIVSVCALLLLSLLYVKKGNSKSGFALYLYVAMYPHNLGALPFLAYSELFLKLLVIMDLAYLVFTSPRVVLNKQKVFFIASIIISDFAILVAGGINAETVSRLLAGFFNIAVLFGLLLEFSLRIKSRQDFENIVSIFRINGLVLSIAAVFEVIKMGALRAEMGAGNPNYLAFYLAVALCLSISFPSENRKHNLVYSAIMVAGIVETGSISILLAVAMFLVLRYLYKVPSLKIKRMSTIILIATTVFVPAVIILTISYSTIVNSVLGQFLPNKDVMRVLIWQDAWNSFLKRPILGHGYNCWRASLTTIIRLEYVTHNDFLRILVDLGLVGAAAFLTIWKRVVISIRNSSAQMQCLYTSLIVLLVWFSSLHNAINTLLFWLILDLPRYDSIISQNQDYPPVSDEPGGLMEGRLQNPAP